MAFGDSSGNFAVWCALVWNNGNFGRIVSFEEIQGMLETLELTTTTERVRERGRDKERRERER